jgi:hypothetical protein
MASGTVWALSWHSVFYRTFCAKPFGKTSAGDGQHPRSTACRETLPASAGEAGSVKNLYTLQNNSLPGLDQARRMSGGGMMW